MRRHPQRAARVGVAELVRQVLRKPQVDAVVDRHDRAARRQRRQHVVRRVEQVGALAPQVAAERELLADRVPGRRLRNRAEVLAAARRPSRGPRRGRTRRSRSSDHAARAAAAGSGRRCRCRSRGACGRRWLCARCRRSYSSSRTLRGSCTLERRYTRRSRRPARMVLLVERQMAAPIGGVHGRRRGRARSAAQVDDLRRRREEDPCGPARGRGAEVDVLGVEEEALVEQADRLGVGAADQQARAADPVDELLAPRARSTARR